MRTGNLGKISRRKTSAFLLTFFLLGVIGLYASYSPKMDINISTTGKFTEGSYGQYRTFSYNITNLEDDEIKPKFWLITPRDRGPRDTISQNISIPPGESKELNVSLARSEKSVPFGSDYQLVVKDLNSKEMISKMIRLNDSKPEKNPYFVDSDYYPYHWRGSSYGLGYYHVNSSGYGINGSFDNCNQTGGCGFVYRDDYELQNMVRISGNSYNLGPSSILTIQIKDENNVEIPLNITGSEKFEKIIDVEKVYEEKGLNFKEENVVYSLSFETKSDSFHWLNIEEFNFYKPR